MERAVKRAEARLRRSALEQAARSRRSAIEEFGDSDTHIGPLNVEAALEDITSTARRQVSRLPIVAALETSKRATPKPLKRELEGRGEVAKLAEKLKRGQLSDENLMTSGVTVPGAGKIAREALDIATQAIPSTYMTADGIVEAAQGKPEKIKKLWEDYEATGAIPPLVKGNFEEAWKRAKERPLTTALEVSGTKAAVGRSVGAGARRVPGKNRASRGVRKAASTDRSDLRLYPRDIDTEPRNVRDIPAKQRGKAKIGPRVERRYSRDVFNKALQKGAEQAQRLRGRDPDVDYGRRSLHLDDETPIRRRLLRQVDTDIFGGEGIRRRGRSEAVRETVKIAPPEGEAIARAVARSNIKPRWSPAVQLAAEGVLRRKTFKADLRKELRRLEEAYPEAEKVSRSVARANRMQQQQIRRILKDEKVDVDAVFEAAGEFARQEGGRQTRLQELGMYTEAEHDVRFMPFAQAHMGARTDKRGRLVVPRKVQVEDRYDRRAALKAVRRRSERELREAERQLEAARTAEAHAEGRAQAQATAARQRTRRKGVRVDPRRTDLTKAQGERLIRTQANRMAAERRVAAARRRLEDVEAGRVELRAQELILGKRKNVEAVGRRERLTRPLTSGEIKAAAKAEGVDPAFVTQRRLKTRSAMYVPTMQDRGAPAPSTRRRSGRSFEVGARELGGEPLLRQAALSEGLATAVTNFMALTRKFGIAARRDGGHARSWNEAVRLGRELTEDANGNLKKGHTPLVPVNVAPFRAMGDKIERIQANARPGANIDRQVADAFAETIKTAFEKPTNGQGTYVLMPEDVMTRIREHQFTRVRGERSVESLTNLFKDVVLTTSSPTTWLLGNVTDLGVRSVMAGLRPTDVIRGAKALGAAKRIDRRRGGEIEQSLAGGGLYHAGQRTSVHRPTRIGQSKAGRVAAAPYRGWRDSVYAVERVIEELPQLAAIGKAMRQDIDFAVSAKGLLKMSDDQVTQFAENLVTNRALEARIQKGVEDVIGRWGKVSPSMRRALGIAPFAQWLGAALRYTFVTLPVHHPIKTALIAAMYEMTDTQRRKLGLTLQGDPSKRVQDYQQGSLPLDVIKGKYGPEITGLGTQRLTSFGTAGGFPENIGDFILPQIKSPLLVALGVSWTGEELVYPDGHPKAGQPLPREERRKIGIGLLMEGIIPFAGSARRIMEQDRSSDPTSTILDPVTRKKWDQEAKRYVEREGNTTDAILDWINPTRKGRLYTEGDIEAIRKAKRRGEVFEELRQRGSTKDKSPRGEFEDFRKRGSEGAREEFDEFRKDRKGGGARDEFEAYTK